MLVGILQLAPKLRAVDENIEEADKALESLQPGQLDLLVLPELAFTGYNFSSLADIEPYLEPTAAGASAAWARRTAARLQCHVSVGYPEICKHEGYPKLIDGVLIAEPREEYDTNGNAASKIEDISHKPRIRRKYNSLLTVNASGKLVCHYRKSNLYYTDASWSWPNPDGFGKAAYKLPFSLFSKSAEDGQLTSLADQAQDTSVATAFAICMDFNPKHFAAPWDDYELATHIQAVNARLLIASNAWLTLKSREEMVEKPSEFDPDTLSYWIARLKPLINDGGWHDSNSSFHHQNRNSGEIQTLPQGSDMQKRPTTLLSKASDTERIIVIANRVGIEPGGVKACDLTKERPPEEEEENGVDPSLTSNLKEQAGTEAGTEAALTNEPTMADPAADADVGSGVLSREAIYAGSSCVIGLRGDGFIRVYGHLGRAEKKLLLVDTNDKPAWTGQLSGAS